MTSRRRRRIAHAALVAACLFPTPALAFSDADVVRGFLSTVFAAEYRSFSFSGRSSRLKRFAGPVRVHIDNRAAIDRTAAVRRFVAALDAGVANLDIGIVPASAPANFRIHVIDRRDYRGVVGRVLGRSDGYAPGKCIARIVSGRRGTVRADAVIVSDEGEFVFRRCLVEEVLQALGPANDDASLPDSVFNDASRHAVFTRFDRLILAMLYDPRLRPGMSAAEATPLLPAVLADAKRRVR